MVFGLTLLLVAACIDLPSEFAHYRRWFEISSDETTLRIAILLSLLAKTLFAMGVGFSVLTFVSAWMTAGLLRLGAVLLGIATIGVIEADLAIQRVTGNPIATYAPYLLEQDASLWAGKGLKVWPIVREIGGRVLLAIGIGSFCGWGVESWASHGSLKRTNATLWFLATLFLTPFIAAPITQRLCESPMTFGVLANRLVWSGSNGLFARTDSLTPIEGVIQKRFQQALPALSLRKPIPRRDNVATMSSNANLSNHPDILMVVVESFRADAIDSLAMPRTQAWSKKGIRFDGHYASSNSSHYGMFAILYGESPIRYFDAIDEEMPTLVRDLENQGYTSYLVSCADFNWRGMSRFMNKSYFEVQTLRGNSMHECDRKSTERASALLAPSERSPRFVLLFLLSTHFGYSFPDDMAPFKPFLSTPNALSLDGNRDREALHNRYRNSLNYVDFITGELIEEIDFNRTLVILTGDHGEALFDDGTLSHASRLSDIQTRVPLIMAGPGVPAGRVHRGLTDHSDVARTIISRLFPGRADSSATTGRDLISGKPREFIALVHAKGSPNDVDQIALVTETKRMGIRLDRVRGFAQFTGKMGIDGRRQRRRLSDQDSEQVTDWFDQYLSEVTQNPKPGQGD